MCESDYTGRTLCVFVFLGQDISLEKIYFAFLNTEIQKHFHNCESVVYHPHITPKTQTEHLNNCIAMHKKPQHVYHGS